MNLRPGIIYAAAICLTLHTEAQNAWNQFRGQNGQGISGLSQPPAIFNASTNLHWRIPIGSGRSSPVVVGNRIFLTTFEDDRLHTLALDKASGRLLWKQTAPAKSIEKVHDFSSPATPTPMADDSRVLVYFGSFGLICYDHDGREVWSKPLPTVKSTYGTASSPIRAGENAVVVLDSNDKTSRLLAVRMTDGSTAWETPRPLASSGWATPMVWNHGTNSEIVVLGSRRLAGYDSRSGKDLWWLDGYSTETIGVPVAGDGLLYVSSSGLAGPPTEGYETMSWQDILPLDRNQNGVLDKSEVPADFRFTIRPELPQDHPGRFMPTPFRSLFDGLDGNRDGKLSESEFMAFVKQWSSRAAPSLRAIRPGGIGDISKSHVVWQLTRGIPEIPSPLYCQGRIYLVRDGGFLTCVNAVSGELIYQERIGAPGSYCASPVMAGDRIFLASHDGVVTVVDAASDKLAVLSRNDLGEKIWATPALADHTLYVRTANNLYAFSDQTATPPPFEYELRSLAIADRRKPPGQGGIVMVGSSIFRQWTNAAELMAPLPVLNRAFGGSKTLDQLIRFEQIVTPCAPKIIVYYCGSNDLKAGELPEVVFERFKRFSERVRRELPATRLVFVSSTRSPDRVAIWDRVNRFNQLVHDYCLATPQHAFIDINPLLFDQQGQPKFELFQPDRLHFLPPAYREFASTIKPVLEKLWNGTE